MELREKFLTLGLCHLRFGRAASQWTKRFQAPQLHALQFPYARDWRIIASRRWRDRSEFLFLCVRLACYQFGSRPTDAGLGLCLGRRRRSDR